MDNKKAAKEKAMGKSVNDFLRRTEVIDKIAPLIDSRVEFSYIPIRKIVIDEQIRSKDDVEEDLQPLIDSIKEKGVIVPVLVVNEGEKYRLIAGERRYRASLAAGAHNLPARILEDGIKREEIMTIQLLENLQRKDLNPVDEARAYYNYYLIRTGKNNVDIQEMISNIITLSNNPGYINKNISDILSEIIKTSGKSAKYIQRLVSILKLPAEATEAIKNKQINMSQAMVFVDNINHPRFFDILTKAIKNKLTAKGILKAFVEKKRGGDIAFYKQRIVKIRQGIERNKENIKREYIEELLKETQNLAKDLQDMLTLPMSKTG